MTDDVSLERAVEQQINLGEKNPAVIAQKVASRFGQEWLSEQLNAYAEEFIADMARRRLGVIRRTRELALRIGDEMASADLKLVKTWVPNVGWKVAADLTISDVRAKADWYRRFARASFQRSIWWDDIGDGMEFEGVVTLGELNRTLPPLPEIGALEAAT